MAQNLTLDLCDPAAIQEDRQVSSDRLAKDERGPGRLGGGGGGRGNREDGARMGMLGELMSATFCHT